ncbi:MAG: biopolymer transporter ExbD [Verrucomicrobia bacterium]|nr:biopolymer transporter ExbD [Verrucomicrobiota bacterium]MCH8513075.1 biopolymer transporter ExbD [Kiritimatiellia bacterium]
MKHSDIAHYRQLTALKRNFTARSRRFPPIVEPAAMVDVVLLILIFFIFSSTFVTRPGVWLSLPTLEESGEGIPLNAMVVTITQQNMIFFNDRLTTLEDLRPAFERMRFEHPNTPLVIEADDQVSLGTNMQVYQFARQAGIRDVAIATRRSIATEGDRPWGR